MPLSPFRARLALAGFVCIGTGIGFNLLALQGRESERSQWLVLPSRAPTTAERDLLERLAREAIEADDAGSQVTEPGSRLPSGARGDTLTHRVASFSPTAGHLTASMQPAGDPVEARRTTVKSVQIELAKRGYEPGTADGSPGLVTRAAVLAYEQDHGLPLTAEPSTEILSHLTRSTKPPRGAAGPSPPLRNSGAGAEYVIRSAQSALRKLGYLTAPADGVASDATVRAIRAFELDAGLVPSGRVSGAVMMRLLQHASLRGPG